MNHAKVTKTGRLQKKFLPAIYFDSSVLIDYWIAEGIQEPNTQMQEVLSQSEDYIDFVREELLRSDVRIKKVIEIRNKLVYGDSNITPIVSPLSLLELVEWHAETVFKQLSSEASGAMFIQKKSKKDIGDYLKKSLEIRKIELRKREKKKKSGSTILERLMEDTWLDSAYPGFEGLWQVDILHFKLLIAEAWTKASISAYLQVGVTDILHILSAKHLGCKYIASFDSDFKRVKDIIKNETRLNLLNSPEEILKIL
jgi:predicted nucleic acid-binding protein